MVEESIKLQEISQKKQEECLLGWSVLKHTEQCLLSLLWEELKSKLDKESRLNFLQINFSLEKTRNTCILFQIVE